MINLQPWEGTAQESRIDNKEFEGKVPASRPDKDKDGSQIALLVASNQYVMVNM